jgi:hypothetical protein
MRLYWFLALCRNLAMDQNRAGRNRTMLVKLEPSFFLESRRIRDLYNITLFVDKATLNSMFDQKRWLSFFSLVFCKDFAVLEQMQM